MIRFGAIVSVVAVAMGLLIAGAVKVGVSVAETLLVVAVGSVGAAAIAWRLHKACY